VSNEEHILCRVHLSLSIDLEISAGPALPIVTAHAALYSSLEMKPSTFNASFKAKDVFIKDTSVAENVLPYVISFSEVDKTSSISTLDQSCFTITFTNSKKSGAVLQVVALPSKIVVNKHFIRKLADVFIYPSIALTRAVEAAKRANMSNQSAASPVQSVNYSSRFEYFSIENISFLLDVDAPKIIFPEDCLRENAAFLVVDTGHLLVRGRLSQQKGLLFDITLTKLTAGLPITLKNCLEAIYPTPTSQYLQALLPNMILSPFDIKLVVENEQDNLPADVVADFELKPELKIEVTPANFARMLHIVESIVSVSGNIAIAVEKGEKDARLLQLTHTAPLRSIKTNSKYSLDNALADFSNFVTLITSKQLPRQKDENLRQKFLIRAKVPLLSLLMRFDSFQNYLSVDLNNLNCNIVSRPWDLIIEATCSRLMIQDTSRAVTQREVLWNNIEGPTPEKMNVNVKIVQVFDTNRSPLFDGVATSVNLGIHYLMIKIDSNTILHLRPFLDSFLAYTMLKKNENTSSDFDDKPLTLQQVHQISKGKSGDSNHALKATKEDLGTRVVFDIQKITIETLRIFNMDEWKPKVGRYGQLESVYRLNLDIIQLIMRIQNDLLSVNVSSRDCSIEDSRLISSEFFYREMVTTKYDRSPWMARIDKVAVNSRDSHFVRTQQTAEPEQKLDFFVVEYEEVAKNKSKIKLDVSRAAVFFSVDNFLDSLHVSLQISFAVMKLVQICDERELFVTESFDSAHQVSAVDASSDKDRRDEDDDADDIPETYKKTKKLTRPDDNVELTVQIQDPLVFLLEDPSLGITTLQVYAMQYITVSSLQQIAQEPFSSAHLLI